MKLSPEIVHKIRSLEIHTKRALVGNVTGDYTSKKRGFGLEFDQLRDYQTGDDVRSIDWKGTARANKMLVREYLQERNKTIMLLVDFSASMRYASRSEDFKNYVAAQIAGVLALIANGMRDTVGVIIMQGSNHIVLPPGRGQAHVHRIMQELFSCTPYGVSSLNDALKTVMQIKRKDMMVIIISDFLSIGYERALALCSRRYETLAIKCYDVLEQTLMNVGLLQIQDPETGKTAVIATNGKPLGDFLKTHHERCVMYCKRARVDFLSVPIHEPFIGDLVTFFKKRMMV